MSIQAVSWVLEKSETRGNARLVLIAVANYADRKSGECWPSQRTIAHEARCSQGSVTASIREAVRLGELEVVDAGDKRRPARYRMTFRERTPISDSDRSPISESGERGSESGERGSENSEIPADLQERPYPLLNRYEPRAREIPADVIGSISAAREAIEHSAGAGTGGGRRTARDLQAQERRDRAAILERLELERANNNPAETETVKP